MSHSKYFSPSAAKRWITCHPSAILNADKENTGNKDADRGTMLHEFCEKNYALAPEEIDFKSLGDDAYDAEAALKAAWKLEAMVGDPDTTVLEMKVPILTGDEPEDEGTADLVMYDRLSGHLLIGDYKFGYNPVLPEMNYQLMIYALGAREFIVRNGVYSNFDKVTLAIIQPKQSREPLIWETTVDELLAWKKAMMDEAVQSIKYLINSKQPPPLEMFKVSEEGCRWCPSKTECVAKNQEIDLLLNTPIEAPPVWTSLDEKADLVERLRAYIDVASAQLGALESEILSTLEAGEVPGFKLVRGRPGNRRWVDAEQADKWLAARKLKMNERYTMKVISPTQAAKVIDISSLSTKLQNAFESMVERPEGKLSWARDTDKRAEVKVASVADLMTDEFADL